MLKKNIRSEFFYNFSNLLLVFSYKVRNYIMKTHLFVTLEM